jgi:glycosyltransferase involved in cell wall biosynthesis/2-polyprenyl-3-methyl-5-hydroxy-6-metoxy-1,4-benzoquinol methylase
VNICTIIARNYLAHARVLAESFRKIHPDGTCSVLVIDDPTGFIDPAEEAFELLTIDQIGLPDPERMAASYDVMELSTAVKPWLLRHLLARPEVEAVAYLDPDIQVFASLEEIDQRARRHDVVLTPHFTAPLPRDGLKPSEEDILIAGSYNLGFIGLGDGETAHALLDWWSERLENECLNEPEYGRFVDQRWIDLAPGLWPGIDVLRETSFNIAYWNLATRSLEDDDGGGYRVDGEPLRFFHFSGFDPRHPTELSRHQNRVDVTANPDLTRICREYAVQLLDHGFEEASGWPYGWGTMPNGIKLDRAARRVFRDAVEIGEIEDSIFSPEGADRFVDYLKKSPVGLRNGGVDRYARALWDTRPDFREAFPNIDRESGAYVSWLHAVAGDAGLSVALLPGDQSSTNGDDPDSAPKRAQTKPGVNLVGYVSSERGVGEAARQIVSALQAADVPTAAIDTPAEPDKISAALGDLADEDHPYDFNLICVNADMLPHVATALGPRFFEGRHSAGLWFWEVSHFPEQWHPAFDYVNEVWVASEHIADTLRPLSSTPVHTIRIPVVPGPPEKASRAELGMPEGFCFLFVFDYRSVFRRKNPLGLVEAFRKAFEPGSGPSLVIKSICGDEFPAERQALAEVVADRPEIHLIEDTITTGMKNAMIASCDCYVSLHRSEGLGLTMAEAMYFGKPVIATAYSGNLDFMTEGNSFLVPHTMVEIGPDANPYPPDKQWAEPDLDRAAALMRQVFENPETAALRAQRAAEDIRRSHSPEAAGDAIKRRIDEVKRHGLLARVDNPDPAQAAKGAPGGRGQLEHLLHFSEPPPRRGAGRLKASAKHLYMRLLRPYAAHQQRINVSIAESLDEIRDVLRETVRMDVENDHTVRMLSQHMAKADELVYAAGAEPYMADDRLGQRTHPVLGNTIGFRTTPGEMDGDGYRGFEDVFRGSEEMIRDRQRVYLDLVADREPVLDAGCGRGEFLDLLAERGIAFQGVDLDADMVKRSREKGYENVEQGDLIDFLERTPASSLGAIFSAQVIEHLELAQLQRFLELGLSRLRPGGLLIAETVNPHSAAALKAFWVDPTHKHPLFPETMLSLCALAGYVAGDIFAPVGSGDWDQDRTRVGEYAVVATAPGGSSS